MNKVKNILIGFILAIPFLMMFSGCSKFLDRKPLQATLDDLNQGGLEGQIYALYGGIRNENIGGQAFGGIPWLAMHGFRADDSEKGSDPADGADWGIIFDQFQYQKEHWAPTIYWDQKYNIIGLANTALQIADSLGLNDPASEINKAEARWFRAWTYFDLVRAYGEVPLITTRIYTQAEARRPKSTVAQIYAQIDEDLNFAIATLPPDWSTASGANRFPGRLTRWAALALSAKTHLYRDRTSALALGRLTEIINSGRFELYNDYFKLFTTEGENSKESIFEIQAYIGPNNTPNLSHVHAIHQGVRGAADWDLGWGWNTPTQTLVDAYGGTDPRENHTILKSGEPDGVYGKVLPPLGVIPRAYWNKKVYPEPAMQASTGNRQGGWINQRVLRYADVLLMAAEIANEIGGAQNVDDALTWLNMVRQRPTVNMPAITFVSKDQLRDAIKHERRIELAMEGERFYDLVRWGDALTVLASYGYQNKHRYYPIPQAAIDFAGGILIQNPEW